MKASLLLALFALAPIAASAQESLPLVNPRILRVSFPDDAGYRVAEGRLIIPPGKAGISDSLGALGWWSRTSRVSDARLQQLRETASRNLGRPLPDPRASFHFHVKDAASVARAEGLLKASEGVAGVRYIPVPRNAAAPSLVPEQRYLADSTSGINADSVYLVYKNRGAGVRICDIEYGFNSTHVDLPPVTVIGPTPIPAYGPDHGTAVLGELGSLHDTSGTTGIASDSKLYFAGAYTLSGQDSIYDIEGPILTAASEFSAGDIILLEQQIAGPNYNPANPASQRGLVPVEWFKPYYDAIVLATGNYISVVEAAGNGQENLDGPAYTTGNDNHFPFDGSANSGAIIVGAGSAVRNSSIWESRGRLSFSNYGRRLDLQGNGENITTTGYGDRHSTGGENYWYTSAFGGTSGASPIVTGAVALLQSVYKSRNNGAVLSPKQVRDILVRTGREQTPAATGDKFVVPIGPLPNVYAAIRSLPAVSVTNVAPLLEASLAPNPAGSEVTVTYDAARAAGALELDVFNALGARVYRVSLGAAAGRHTIPLAAFPAGIYQVRLSDGQRSAGMKLSVRH